MCKYAASLHEVDSYETVGFECAGQCGDKAVVHSASGTELFQCYSSFFSDGEKQGCHQGDAVLCNLSRVRAGEAVF